MRRDDWKCAVPSCTASRPHDRLMCRPHWRAVPRALQDEVWSAWMARLAGREDGLERHEAAKAAAIRAVEPEAVPS